MTVWSGNKDIVTVIKPLWKVVIVETGKVLLAVINLVVYLCMGRVLEKNDSD